MVDYCRPKAPVFTTEALKASKKEDSTTIDTVSQLCPAGPTLGSPGLNHQIIPFNKRRSIDYLWYIWIEDSFNVGLNGYPK